MVVKPDVHGIQTRLGEPQLLDVHDEIARDEMRVLGQRHRHGNLDGRHDGTAVGVDEIQRELVLTLVAGVKGDAQRHGALGMDGGELRRVNRIERAEQVELAVVVRRGVTENGHLNVHGEIKTRIPRIGTHFFYSNFPLDIHINSMYRAPMIRKELVAASAEPLILSLLSRGESYGYAIIQEVKARSGGKLQWTDGMLYPVLHRMEHRGLIKSRWAESETGRKRKYYSLKKDGKHAMQEHHAQWSLVHSVLAGLRKEQYV